MSKKCSQNFPLNISRRDFVGGTLVGAGAALLSTVAPIHAASRMPVSPSKGYDPWTGYGGVGDYANSNGNVASVRETAHLIRDGYAKQMAENSQDTAEEYDMVIVGGGFSGMGAAYQFHQKFGCSKKCLILENHPVFGGFAKQNEFDVDGYRLYGAQASFGIVPPSKSATGIWADIYRAVGLPQDYRFSEFHNATQKI